MIVVSNTSPLTSLAVIGQFDLLRKLFGEIHIPHGVWEELNHGGQRHPGSNEVENSSWVHRQKVSDQTVLVLLQRDLDRGEAETLTLALELKADLVLLDEQEGRHAAIRLGFQPFGVLGILLQAKRKGHVGEIRSLLDAFGAKRVSFLATTSIDRSWRKQVRTDWSNDEKSRADPAIDEIREIRHRISERFDHDPERLVAYYMELQEKYRDRFVGASPPTKPRPDSDS
jgi:predicted nucleic acid-binding protein